MVLQVSSATARKLNDLAAESGRALDDIVEDALAGYLEEVVALPKRSMAVMRILPAGGLRRSTVTKHSNDCARRVPFDDQVLSKLKDLLVLNWRQKAAARSQLRLAIEDTLDTGLPRVYTPEIYQQKCSTLFEHVYESYPERNGGPYAL